MVLNGVDHVVRGALDSECRIISGVITTLKFVDGERGSPTLALLLSTSGAGLA